MNTDLSKTREQLVTELDEMRQRVAVLEAAEAKSERTEEALADSERRLKEAQTLGKIGYWEFDIAHQSITWANETYRLYGRDPALGPPTVAEEASYYTEEQMATLRDYADRAVKDGTAFEYDLEANLPGRGRVWFTASMRPIRDDEGRIVRLFGTVQDITERKQADEALRELDERYRDFFQNAPVGLHIFGPDGAIVDINRAELDMLGYSRDEIVGRKSWGDLVVPEQTQTFAQHWETLTRGGAVADLEYTLVRKDGGHVIVLLHASARFDSERKIVNTRGTVLDITKRKQAEETLRENEAKWQVLSENTPAQLLMLNENLEILFANRDLRPMSKENAIGRRITSFLSPDAQQRVKDNCKAVWQSGNPMEYSSEHVNPYGEYKCHDHWIAPIFKDGKVTALMISSLEVTERRNTERQVRQSQVLASLGEMTAGIAHEVNNPLAAILLYSELISHAGLPPAVKRDLMVIRSEAKRASNIMKNLLTYSRKAEPITRLMDIHRTLRKVVDMRRYEEQVRNIDIAVNVAQGPLRVKGNAAQLTQVFMNLIVNAEEAVENCGDKRIVVTTTSDGDRVRISIADSGIGIPEENLVQVFVPFFSTKPTGKGTGLGLATCHGIVTAHGGLIRAENNDMGGATFIVELPRAR